jgi:uncharacterized membrane protein YeaQ/YmgE (transglycosylase-associated protein family)
MPTFSWLIIGGAVGFVAKSVIGGKAYGTLTDTLLGMAGAFLANKILRLPSIDAKMSWADESLLMIWSAVAFLLLVRFIAKRQASGRMQGMEHMAANPQGQQTQRRPHPEANPVGLTVDNNYISRSNNTSRAILPSP